LIKRPVFGLRNLRAEPRRGIAFNVTAKAEKKIEVKISFINWGKN
jgi:hypothetical protein